MRRLVGTILLLLIVSPAVSRAQEPVEVTESITSDAVWTSDTEYILVGRIFVEDGATLTIEPGTVIKGRFNADPNNAAALVISRGAKIYAEGTPAQPIIFTAEDDDVSDPSDLATDDRALWGGVIILGRAGINVAGGEEQVEGLPEGDPRGA